MSDDLRERSEGDDTHGQNGSRSGRASPLLADTKSFATWKTTPGSTEAEPPARRPTPGAGRPAAKHSTARARPSARSAQHSLGRRRHRRRRPARRGPRRTHGGRRGRCVVRAVARPRARVCAAAGRWPQPLVGGGAFHAAGWARTRATSERFSRFDAARRDAALPPALKLDFEAPSSRG